MARGDVTIFEEALAKMISGDWASTDHFYCAICDNTTTPTAATATPVIGDFTQVGDSGTYVDGGTDLGALSALVSEAAGTMTFDSTTNPSWEQDDDNDILKIPGTFGPEIVHGNHSERNQHRNRSIFEDK